MIRITRRVTSITAAGAVLALVAAACSSGTTGGTGGTGTTSGPAVKGGTLNMLGSGDIDYMDPNISYYSIGSLNLRMWARNLFANPAIKGQETTAAPDLAEKIPTTSNGGVSSDGKTYTVTIRKGAKWDTSPARQVTAADVVRGVKRTCNPVQPFGGLPDYETLIQGFQSFCNGFAKVKGTVPAIKNYVENTKLSGVVATSDRTVQFHLTHPVPFFVDMLTMNSFDPAPIEVLNYLPASSQLAQHQIANGPYRVQSYTPTKSIVYTRNPAWDPSTDPIRKAYVDKIVIDETVSQESTQQQLQTASPSADMEFNNFPPPSQLPQLIAQKDPLLNLGKTSSTNPYIWFNEVSPNNNSAMKKLQVRQALEYALNRNNIIQVYGGPKVNPPLTHVIPSLIDGSQNFNMYPYDPNKAKQLLKQAGFPNGLTMKYIYSNDSEGSRKTFATVQQDLSKAGIKVTGVPVPSADLYTKYLQVPSVSKRGVWDLAASGWGSDWYGNAALSYFAPLFSGPPSFPPQGSNFGFYDSSKTNAIINQATNAKTNSESLNGWAQADRQVMKDAAFFPITEPLQANYRAKQVNNAVYLPTIQNFDPTNIWLSSGQQGG